MGKAVLCLAAILLAGFLCEANETRINATASSSRFGDFNMYFLFDRDNSRVAQRIYATTASVNGIRNIRQKTVVIIHGHEGSASTSLNPSLKDAFLFSEDVTVIVVDWSFMAGQNYANAVGAVSGVGVAVADLLRLMIARNLVNLTRLHLVGLGLGAHVCAAVARSLTTGTVSRITALDPAGPSFENSADRLLQSDAAYVEVIHTDTEGNGLATAIGHVDFFPNGGATQAGCDASECNHKRAWQLFAASLTHQSLDANQCEDIDKITADDCKGFSLALGNNEMIKYGAGVFFLETTEVYPYGVQGCTKLCDST